jgi:hypothetical protein
VQIPAHPSSVHSAAATKVGKTLLRVHHALEQFGFRFVLLEEFMQNSASSFVAYTPRHIAIRVSFLSEYFCGFGWGHLLTVKRGWLLNGNDQGVCNIGHQSPASG